MPQVKTNLGPRQIIQSYRFGLFDKVLIDGVENGVASSDGRIHVFVRKDGPASLSANDMSRLIWPHGNEKRRLSRSK
ncbi:hypothetical protein [Candidatus Phyllobacterium onerii]|uniref:hypothetical protein n=1 Tax=Candidatus Phyllobacterium onerii TaxID=3020828 RepID=UPI002330BEB9|nr:hypothetical protein [Phyllobacterium sp. IY22]